jgi:di- and tripeptidase
VEADFRYLSSVNRPKFTTPLRSFNDISMEVLAGRPKKGQGVARKLSANSRIEDSLDAITSDDGDRDILADRTGANSASSAKGAPPELFHRVQHDSSILALAVSDQYIYAGTQDGEILVWSLGSYELVARIQAHKRAVLCLFLSHDGKLLFSSAGDAIVNAWCPRDLKRIYHIYSTYDVGDVFSVAYSTQFQTAYLGAQNTSIQWVNLKDSSSRPKPNKERHPDKRNHRFFDSTNAGGASTPRPESTSRSDQLATGGETVEIDKSHMKHYAHFGYVYCMLMVRGASRLVEPEEDMLISGGGDGTIKLWKLSADPDDGIEELACLGEDDAESVLSLTLDGSFLYSGKLEGVVELWDLDTKQKLRVIKAHNGDVMTLQMGWGFLFSAGATGFSRVSGILNLIYFVRD